MNISVEKWGNIMAYPCELNWSKECDGCGECGSSNVCCICDRALDEDNTYIVYDDLYCKECLLNFCRA